MFKSAYNQGRQYGFVNTARYSTPETVIFEGMKNNPFKSKKSRDEFIRGVSDGMNKLARMRTHREIYGA